MGVQINIASTEIEKLSFLDETPKPLTDTPLLTSTTLFGTSVMV
jgi:hypothetical protein